MDMFVGMFSPCTLLSTLNFHENDMKHETDLESTFVNDLSSMEILTDLNVKDNRLGGFLHMVVVLDKCKGIQYLDLGLVLIGDSGVTNLTGVITV